MNLPNKITLIRILIVPLMILFLLWEQIEYRFIISGALFLISAITDYIDGKIARSRGMITDFGKFADPLADKILIISALICFIQLNLINCIPVIIIIFREFMVTSVRLIAIQKGAVVSANNWGKLKTFSQIIAIIIIITAAQMNKFLFIGEIAIWISTIITIISGIIYIENNKKLINMLE